MINEIAKWPLKCARVFLIVLLIVAGTEAQSQYPPPSPTGADKPPQAQTEPPQQETTANQRNADGEPPIAKVIPFPDAEAETATPAVVHEDKSAADWWLVRLTGITAVILALQLFVFGWQGCQLRRTVTSVAKTERAYVKMSHYPPGLIIETDGRSCLVNIEIRNLGRTPARVTGGRLIARVVPKCASVPKPPSDSDEGQEISPAFLVTNDWFYFSQRYAPDMALILSGKVEFWVMGYVDYTDVFEKRYRGGYARSYKPTRDIKDPEVYPTEEAFTKRSNLVFVSGHGYNYDRPRKEGEGNDWGISGR